MKKILFIGMSPNQGGIETFIMNIFNNFEGNGYHFDFINTSNDNLAYSYTIIKKGGSIKNVSINHYLSRYRTAYNFFSNNYQYDVVHLNVSSINSIFWLKAAKKFNIKKLIIHSHNNEIEHKSRAKSFLATLLTIINRKYLNNNQDIIELAASKSSGNWMFHNNRFKVIDNGINTNKFLFNNNYRTILRKRLNIRIEDKIIITVARIDYQKNYERIINIFKQINTKMPNTKLVIVGDGPKARQIYSLIKKLGLLNDVIFLGIRDDVDKILNIADLMLMPSRYEGFPFSLIEAQSSGVPALVSLEAVPNSANITNTLKYISLNNNNNIWSNVAINMLNDPYSARFKIKMNNMVAHSKYNIKVTMKQIKNIY